MICTAIQNAVTPSPTFSPTSEPSATPTAVPTATPTDAPTANPTDAPTAIPTDAPTAAPALTFAPTPTPSFRPTSGGEVAPFASTAAGKGVIAGVVIGGTLPLLLLFLLLWSCLGGYEFGVAARTQQATPVEQVHLSSKKGMNME